MPWDWIADETRSIRAPEAWASADAGLAAFAATYRRDAWLSQPKWIEVWVESDSLAGTLVDVTWELGVRLFSGRGFASLTSLRLAAEQIAHRVAERDQPTAVIYLGDLDPSGWEASASARRGLERHLDDLGVDPGALDFERLAVEPNDVETYHLPTGAPPKWAGPGSKSWWRPDGPRLPFTVEAEAFEPDVLRDLVKQIILALADVDALERARKVEELERETLRNVAAASLLFKHGKELGVDP